MPERKDPHVNRIRAPWTAPLPSPLLVPAALLLALCLDGVADAYQRRGRRPSRAQIKAAQENAAFMQLEMVRYQSEMAQAMQEIQKSFDANGDGLVKGPEKAKLDKHMREIQTGKAPNPFAMILPVGQGPRPKSPIEELKKKASDYQAGIVAKQQEIFNSFDADGSGDLEGPEKSKFNAYMRDVQSGRVPNPFAAAAATTK